MRYTSLEIVGAFAITAQPFVDHRGAFARITCAREFAERGLVAQFAQQSISSNARRGTIRGLHFQAPPFLETKLVRCIKGAVYIVIVDLRPSASTFRRWCALELCATTWASVYIPKGCASGFQSLEDDSQVEYLITPAYVPERARGVRWDDPLLGIDWPIKKGVILSERDLQLPSIETIEPFHGL